MINRIIRESSIDYPGKFGPLIFTAGCNFKCSFCHNAQLNSASDFLNEDDVINSIELKVKTGWYNGICISGGEPTIHRGLEDFIRRLKALGLSVKLDSNGTNPEILKKLLDEKLVDYVAMDIKGPRELYSEIVGVAVDMKKIEESIKILSALPVEMYEFRTTIPFILKPYVRIISLDEVKAMVKWIYDLNGGKAKWYVQQFISRHKEDMNDERLSTQVMPKELHKTPDSIAEDIKKIIGESGFKSQIR